MDKCPSCGCIEYEYMQSSRMVGAFGEPAECTYEDTVPVTVKCRGCGRRFRRSAATKPTTRGGSSDG